ncbi:MAG: SDR family NAD(P)-dependent oxidoreductase [Inquilinaceae bacterium]
MSLQNRTAWVTGAGRGIGRGIALSLAKAGAAVLVTDIDLEAARAVENEIAAAGGEAQAIKTDVTRPDEVDGAAAFTIERFGALDILVSNAGTTERSGFLDLTLDDWNRVLRINLTGVFLCGQAAGRAMRRQGGGRIINIASVSGQRGGVGRAAYGASKAAILNLTQTMAIELGPHGILVNAIAPGPTWVEPGPPDRAPAPAFADRMVLKRFAAPEEIGAAAVFLASDGCSFTTGAVLNVDGGFGNTGVMPDADDAGGHGAP